MYEKCAASLRMTRMILEGGSLDETVYKCQVIAYHQESECIYLLTGRSGLTAFSLDGIYECMVETEEGIVRCRGMIRERYGNKLGKIVVMKVKNGFYKNTVN